VGKHFDRAQILIEQGRYDLAETELREEIAENPNLDRGYGTLALCFINERKLTSETLELIQHALSLDAENDWNYYVLAIYWYHRNDFDRAVVAIKIAIEIESNSYFYFYILASVLADRGQAKFELDTTTNRIFHLIRVSYFIRPYLKSVFPSLEKSLALNPQYLPALNLQTNLLGATGQIKRALHSSRAALEIDPDNAIAHRLHGQILTDCGIYSEAVEYFQSALRIDPTYNQAKQGLLEAMRSQYWIYPWISITNWRGRLVFLLTFPIGIIAISLIRNTLDASALDKTHLELFIYSIISTIVILSFPSQLIFNLFLRLEEKNKLLINIQDAIVVNYTTGLTTTILFSIYTAMVFGNNSDRYTEMTIVSIVVAAIASISTFLPINSQSKSPFFSIGYQLSVAILGIISIVVYIKFNDLERICPLFGFLVLGSPLIATSLSPGWNYELEVVQSARNPNDEIDPVQNPILVAIFNIGNYIENWLVNIIDRLPTNRPMNSKFISKWFVLIFAGIACFILMIGGGTLFVMICRSLLQK
jgi:tetratricopeptide (TPR) repeat protein